MTVAESATLSTTPLNMYMYEDLKTEQTIMGRQKMWEVSIPMTVNDGSSWSATLSIPLALIRNKLLREDKNSNFHSTDCA